MTRLKNVQFVGFKLGLRIADSYVKSLKDVNEPTAVTGLHTIKGLLNVSELSRSVHVVGVNNVVYAPTEVTK